MGTADWIAADWGAKHLRLWAMRDADVFAARQSDQGAADLTHDQFAQVLAQETADWRAGDWAHGRFRLPPGDDAEFTPAPER